MRLPKSEIMHSKSVQSTEGQRLKEQLLRSETHCLIGPDMAPKSTFLDKVLGRIGRLDAEGLQTVVQRLARERTFLEMLFNTIEDGVLVVDEAGRILYFNQAVTRLMGIQGGSRKASLLGDGCRILTGEALRHGPHRRTGVLRQEFEVGSPRPRFIRMYAAPLDGESTGSAGVAFILHDATEARQQTFAPLKANASKPDSFGRSVAHEIGNPLNALSVHLQLIEREIEKSKTTAARYGWCWPVAFQKFQNG